MDKAWLVTQTLTTHGTKTPQTQTFILIGKHPVRYALEGNRTISMSYTATLDFFAEISLEEAMAHLEAKGQLSAFEVLDYR